MSRKSIWLTLGALVTAAVLVSSAFAEKEGKKYKDVEEMMEHVHEGRSSPYKATAATLKGDKPDWELISKQLPALQKMAAVLKNHKAGAIKESAGGYADAVDTLVTAAGKKNTADAQAAMKNLSASCSDCHYKGGPGGKKD